MNQQTTATVEITPGATLAPAPDWVDIAPYAIPNAPNPHFIASGLCALLDDSQIDLCGADRAWFCRRADMVTADAGTQHASQFSVSFDPVFERIEVHAVTVIRGAQRIEHAKAEAFEVLRRERNLERLQFDGRMTVHLTIPDVRQGDVVESSYTAYGSRKSLGGRHSAFIALEWPVGIVEVRLRQRAPAQRAVAERGYNNPPVATQTENNGIVDRRWRTLERPGFRYEPLAPPWALQSAALQFSEWRSWAEVATAFTPLYDNADALPDEIEQEIARIAAAEATPGGRAAAVLRFTQSAVRYLAISIGEGGFTPRQLGEICTTRYGDCKDKSKLFVQMARRLGVDACPALVNTRDGYALADWLPSAQLFDHCIVRVATAGKVHWLDPTRMMQPSPIDKISQCHFGWALPLRDGSEGLERMADPPVAHLVDTEETIILSAPGTPIRYDWKHTFKDVRAEAAREQFAREGAVSVFRSYAEDLQKTWPQARVISQELVSDDVATNTLVVHEAYELHGAWTPAGPAAHSFTTRDLNMTGTLAVLEGGERKNDIYLGLPGKRTRRVTVRTAKPHEGGWLREHRVTNLRHSDEMRLTNPRQMLITQMLEIKALTLPAKEAESYRKIQTNMANNELVVTETDLEAGDAPAFWTVAGWILLGVLGLYLLVRFG